MSAFSSLPTTHPSCLLVLSAFSDEEDGTGNRDSSQWGGRNRGGGKNNRRVYVERIESDKEIGTMTESTKEKKRERS